MNGPRDSHDLLIFSVRNLINTCCFRNFCMVATWFSKTELETPAKQRLKRMNKNMRLWGATHCMEEGTRRTSKHHTSPKKEQMKNKNMFEKAMSFFSKTHHVSHRNFRKLNFEKLYIDITSFEGGRLRLKNGSLENSQC